MGSHAVAAAAEPTSSVAAAFLYIVGLAWISFEQMSVCMCAMLRIRRCLASSARSENLFTSSCRLAPTAVLLAGESYTRVTSPIWEANAQLVVPVESQRDEACAVLPPGNKKGWRVHGSLDSLQRLYHTVMRSTWL